VAKPQVWARRLSVRRAGERPRNAAGREGKCCPAAVIIVFVLVFFIIIVIISFVAAAAARCRRP
jgi:hypothetical protein